MASAAKEFRKAQEAGWDEAQAQIGLMKALVYMRDYKKVTGYYQYQGGLCSRGSCKFIWIKGICRGGIRLRRAG